MIKHFLILDKLLFSLLLRENSYSDLSGPMWKRIFLLHLMTGLATLGSKDEK